MSLLRLMILTALLAGGVGLVLSNPTMEDYLGFVEQEMGKALDKMDPDTPGQERQFLRQVFRSRGRQLLEGLVRPRTVRQNWGLFSRYKTTVSDAEVLVVGIAGTFIPVKGVDAAVLRIGRMVF